MASKITGQCIKISSEKAELEAENRLKYRDDGVENYWTVHGVEILYAHECTNQVRLSGWEKIR
jgi:hypothetical protein